MRGVKLPILAFIFLFLLEGVLLAQEKGASDGWVIPPARRGMEPPPERDLNILNIVVWTIFVVGLVGVFFFLLKKFSRTRLFSTLGVIKVLSRRQLSTTHTLYLVQVGSKVFLIGATRGGITTLGEFSGDEAVLIKASSQPSREESSRTLFKEALEEGLKTETSEEETIGNIASELEQIRDKVRSWKEGNIG
jgi:flagellar biogenesis protein FliO